MSDTTTCRINELEKALERAHDAFGGLRQSTLFTSCRVAGGYLKEEANAFVDKLEEWYEYTGSVLHPAKKQQKEGEEHA